MNSVYDKDIVNQRIKRRCNKLLVICFQFKSGRVATSELIVPFFVELKSKTGLRYNELTTSKISPEDLTPTLLERHYLPDIEKNDPKD